MLNIILSTLDEAFLARDAEYLYAYACGSVLGVGLGTGLALIWELIEHVFLHVLKKHVFTDDERSPRAPLFTNRRLRCVVQLLLKGLVLSLALQISIYFRFNAVRVLRTYAMFLIACGCHLLSRYIFNLVDQKIRKSTVDEPIYEEELSTTSPISQ